MCDYPIQDLELVFVELPKFDRALDEPLTLTDKWAYFLDHARELETIPDTLRTVAAIEHQEFFIQDQRGAIIKASKQALEQGLRQGLERGLEQGQQQAQVDIARQLLAHLG